MDAIEKGLQGMWEKLETWVVLVIQALPNMLIAVLVFTFFWFVSRWLHRIALKMFGSTHLKESLKHFLADIVKILVICLGAVLALSILQLEKAVFSMLAGVGVIGLALGFAFQDLAANFISGIMLAVRAPIQVNDVIEISGTQGRVIEIRLRDTLIKNFSGQHVIIPNKDFTTNKLINFSSNGSRRIRFEIGVSYADDLNGAKSAILNRLRSIENLLKDPEPEVNISALGDSAVILTVDVWIAYPGENPSKVTDSAMLAAKEAIETGGFSIPYPTRSLIFENQSEEKSETI